MRVELGGAWIVLVARRARRRRDEEQRLHPVGFLRGLGPRFLGLGVGADSVDDIERAAANLDRLGVA